MHSWLERWRILLPPWHMTMLSALSVSYLLLLATPARAQRGHGVIINIVIMLEGAREPYDKQITVTLRDGWGNIEGGAATDKGYVQLVATGDGLHRLLIVGPEIESYDEEFSLETGYTYTVYVQPRRTLTKVATSKAGEAVSSSRLQAPKNAVKEFEKGRSAALKNNRGEAKEHLQKAIRLYPRYDDAFSALGELELQEGDREGAQCDLAKALELNPNHPEAAHNLAGMLVAEAKYSEAEPLLQVWLRGHPDDAWALSFAALGQFTEGKFEEAAANARRVHVFPHQQYASAHMIAGRALERLWRPEVAAAEYRLYLAEAPNGPNAGHARAALARLTSERQTGSQPQ